MADSREDIRKTLSEMKARKLAETDVSVTPDERLRVEFRIDDLVRKLAPGGALSSCGGCNGCSGCSM